jgi:glycosyltransferase involved in cell wall biosynthesis
MSASRNLGVSQARGRYVGFLDADDVWLPGKLAEQCAILDARPDCGMVYGRTLIWRSWNGGGEDFTYPLGVEPDTAHRPPRLFELLVENKAQSPTTCNALMRRSLIEQVGGFEADFRGMFEDQAFFAPRRCSPGRPMSTADSGPNIDSTRQVARLFPSAPGLIAERGRAYCAGYAATFAASWMPIRMRARNWFVSCAGTPC